MVECNLSKSFGGPPPFELMVKIEESYRKMIARIQKQLVRGPILKLADQYL